VAGLSPQRPRFDPKSVLVRFVICNVAVGQVFLLLLGSSPDIIIPLMIHTDPVAQSV
jgi:hypothetical protein